MSVWVVSLHVQYESGNAVGVFATETAAREFASKCEEEHAHWGDAYVLVKEFPVQG